MIAKTEPLTALVNYEREVIEQHARLSPGQLGLWLRAAWTPPAAGKWMQVLASPSGMVSPVRADLAHWPIEPNCVDRIVLEHVLEGAPEGLAWREAVGALRPGGMVLLSAFARARRRLPVSTPYSMRAALRDCRELGLKVLHVQAIGVAWPWLDCATRRARWVGRLLPSSAPSFVLCATLEGPLVRRPALRSRRLRDSIALPHAGRSW